MGVLLFERSRQRPGVRPQDGRVAAVPQHHLRFKKEKKMIYCSTKVQEGGSGWTLTLTHLIQLRRLRVRRQGQQRREGEGSGLTAVVNGVVFHLQGVGPGKEDVRHVMQKQKSLHCKRISLVCIFEIVFE